MASNVEERSARAYSFGPFQLIPERQLLLRDERPVRIGGRALEILTVLVERPGELIDKRDLLARVWPNTFVEEGNLKVNMAALRRALGEGPYTAQYVATVVGRGYRFVAPVQLSSNAEREIDLAGVSHGHNLPCATTRIVGRDEVVDAIRQEMAEARLVSIVGAGGIGKTTVALVVAEHMVGRAKDGVWFIDLSPLKDPALVPNAIAMAIGIGASSADMLAELSRFLRDRDMLLLLDNCEHLLDGVAICVDRILTEAAGVKLLVTSREPLGVKGERVRRLPGLGIPPGGSGLTAKAALTFPAIQLFVERATDRLETFNLTDADAPEAAEICRRLDGLALAIELAATRVDAFGVAGLLQQLDNRFRLLVSWRGGPERHRTLAATLDWSYSLLAEREASLLRAISVFAGAFAASDATAMISSDTVETLDALAQLATKSLVAVDMTGDSVTYRLLDSTRAYATERLRLDGEESAARRRHAEHICMVLEQAATEWDVLPGRQWGARYGRVIDDLRSALYWTNEDAVDAKLCVRLTVAGLLLWNHLSLTDECRIHVTRAVRELATSGLIGTAFEMQLQVWLGGSTMFTRSVASPPLVALRRALEIAIKLGDLDCRVRCLRLIGVYQLLAGEHGAAIGTLEEFTALAASEMPSVLPDAEAALGMAEFYIGRLVEVRDRFERRHQRDVEDIGDAQHGLHHVRYFSVRLVDVAITLAHLQWLTGSPRQALDTAKWAIAYALTSEHHLSLSIALTWGCPVLYWTGQFEECARTAAMLDEQITRHGFDIRRPVTIFYRAAIADAQGDVAADGISGQERAIAAFEATGYRTRVPFYRGMLAEALARSGRLEEAEAMIEAALQRATEKCERWCMPELKRIRASILLAANRADEAEAQLLDAVDSARQIGALSWQLRAATDLARLWRDRSRTKDARDLLAPVLGAFTEGVETRDLLAAADVLASLIIVPAP